MNISKKYIFFAIAIGIIILDRITKILASLYLIDLDHPVRVIQGFFNLIYSTNRGALFGFMDTLSDPFRFITLSLFPIVVVVIIVIILLKAGPEEKLLSTGMALILGGAVGNLTDRFIYGHVIDFLDLYIGRYHWPTFNLADSFITAGIAMIFFEMLFKRR
jgi:signal peptidase II